MDNKKEVYVPPVLVKHELLRDITAAASGYCRRFGGSPIPGLTCPQ